MPKLCGRIGDGSYGFAMQSCENVSETVAMALPCQNSVVSNEQARRPRLRLAVSAQIGKR